MEKLLVDYFTFQNTFCSPKVKDYYHHKMNVPAASGVTKKVLSRLLASQILTVVLQKRQKPSVKHFIGKSMLLNFAALLAIFCSKPCKGTYFYLRKILNF